MLDDTSATAARMVADEDVRTITDADARAIAKAMMAEATKQILMGTGRGVWSAIKVMVFPLLLALILWWLTTQGKVVLPSRGGTH